MWGWRFLNSSKTRACAAPVADTVLVEPKPETRRVILPSA